MRCLSIAEQLRECGARVIFFMADNAITTVVENKGFEYICLNSQWDNMESELSSIHLYLKKYDVSAILVDSYYVTQVYLQSLKSCAKVFYIDDLNSMEYPADVIINYNIYGEDIRYPENLYKRLYLGPSYAPLRSEFMNKPQRRYAGVKKILITSGGTDEYNVVGHFLDAFAKNSNFEDLEFYSVLGRFNKNIDDLKTKFKDCVNVHLLVNINNMAHYMSTCDVAITAGGSTCYELCACGLPSIVYTLADNQNGIATTFSKRGIVPWIGDVRCEIEKCIDNLFVELEKLDNKEYWEKQSQRTQTLVDGKGASRLAKALLEDF